MQVDDAGHDEGQRGQKHAGSKFLQGCVDQTYLREKRIDADLEERYESEDQQRVDHLHLIRLQQKTANLPVHSGSLESPSRALLIVESPKHRQRYEQLQHLKRDFDVVDQLAIVRVFGVIEPVVAFLAFALYFVENCALRFVEQKERIFRDRVYLSVGKRQKRGRERERESWT